MAARRVTEPLVIVLFSLILSLAIFSTVFLIGRLTDTARASTGDLGAWSNTTPLTNQLWAFAAAASSSYVYISGGEVPTGTVNLTTTQRAAINSDGSLGPWQEQTLLSAARIDHGMVYTETATGNRCLYVVGGYVTQAETVTSSVEYATVGPDGAVVAWAPTSFMSTPRAHFGLAAYGGRLYSLGGSSTGGSVTSTVEFAPINSDCSLGGWQGTLPMTSTHSGNRAFAANGFLYNTGDMSDTLASGVQYALINPNNGTIGSWTATNAMNQKRADHAVLADTRAGYAYVLGGVSPTSTQTASVERAALNPDGTLGSWATMASLPAPLEDMAFAQANGRVYMLGGRSGTITNTVLFSTIEGAGLPNLSTSAKRVGSSGASPGQAIIYTIVLSNTGTGGASALLTDTLPVSVTYVPGSVTGGGTYVTATRSITWTGAVAAGVAVTITYTGVISSPLDNGTAITNTASINDGANPAFETVPVTTTISSAPNLSTSTKLVNMAVVTPGQTITYTVFLTNTGNMNASARLTDTLPVSVTYVSGSATGGAAYNSGSRSITWAGSVTTASPISITYRAAITSPLDNGTLITNTSIINDGFNAPFDTLPVTTTISSSPVLSTSRKLVNKPISNPGGMVAYSIVVSNTGTMNTSARVTDTLPANLTYVTNTLQSTMGASLHDPSTNAVLWAGPALVGVPVTVSYQARVNSSLSSGTLVTNTATVQPAGAAAGETPSVTVTVASNPSRIGWTNLGLFGAIVSDLAIDPTTDTVYVATSGTSGVYRSVNGGESWVLTTLPSNCGPVLVERSSGMAYAACQQSLWKSSNAGLSWSLALTRTTTSAFPGLAGAVAVSSTVIYVGDTDGGVWRSSDAGTTWAKRGAPAAKSIRQVAVDPTNLSLVYATISDKVFKSSDGGAIWSEITPAGDTDFYAVAVSPHSSSLVFVGTGENGGGKRLYKSTDGGLNWTTLGGQHAAVSRIGFHPTNASYIYLQGEMSPDGGATWQGFEAAGGGWAIDPRNPSVIYGNSSQGVHKSTDGGVTWTEVNTGLEEVPVDDVGQNPRDPNTFFIASRNGYGRTFDSGLNWTWPLSTRPAADPAGFAVALDPSSVYIAGNDLAKSTDSGRTWTATNLRQVQEADLGGGRSAQVQQMGIVPGQATHLFAALAEPTAGVVIPKGGLYESTDGGLTWAATNLKGLPVNTAGFGATGSSTIIYAGVGNINGVPLVAGGVYTSTVSNSSAWSQTSVSNAVISELRVHPSNPLVVYAGGFIPSGQSPYQTVLYKTTDGGATWNNLLPSTQRENLVRAIAIDPVFPDNLFYATAGKISQSADGGNTWSLFSEADLGGEGINALVVPLAAPSPVVTFTAAITGGLAVLSWRNPSDADFAGVTIRNSTQGFPVLSSEGITLTTVPGSAGASSVYTHTGVVSGTTYYYSAFAYNQAGRYSLPNQVAANSVLAAASLGIAELGLVGSASGPFRRLREQTATRNLYAATGGGLFARSIEGAAQKIYLPYLAKNHAAGW